MRLSGSARARFGAVAVIAAGGCALASGCRRPPPTAPVAQSGAQQDPGTLVSVTPARVRPMSETVLVTGSLAALHDVTVGIKNAGKIVAVYFREGDYVRAGQIVAQQDTTDLESQMDQQLANLATARTRQEQAQAAYTSAVTTLSLTDAQTRSAVNQAQAALDAARQQEATVKQGARQQEIRQAEANAAAAKADRDQARSDLTRYEDLYRQEAVSAQQLQQAQSAADAAEARYNSALQALELLQVGNRPEDVRRAQDAVDQAIQEVRIARANRDQVALRRADVANARAGILAAADGVRQAQAAVAVARQAIRDASIRSPIDGVVAERKVEPGTQLTTVKPDVMRIVALDSVYYDAQVTETQYEGVLPGQPASVTVDALGGRAFHGQVLKIYPVASSTARTFTVRIGMRNVGELMRPGMYARGSIRLAEHPRAIVVPKNSVVDDNGVTGYVFVVSGGVGHERTVRLGFRNQTVTEVKGLEPGDLVVSTGQGQLQDGAKVQVTP